MNRTVLILTVLAGAFAFAPPAGAHTLATATAWARLNRSITNRFIDSGTAVVERRHFCWRNSRHRVTCAFGLGFEAGGIEAGRGVCGRGYVIQHAGAAWTGRWWSGRAGTGEYCISND